MIEQDNKFKISDTALELAEKLGSIFEAGVKADVSFECIATVAQQELAEWKVDPAQNHLANN
ncbi:MAG: hypothetical protein ABJO86_02460 [Lentilitoribacter sp.]